MKKSIFTMAVLTAMYGSVAFAADNAAEALVSGQAVILTDCSLLADDVTPSLSNGVIGGYNCVTATNSVVVATCHQNGRTATRTVETPCVVGADEDEGEVECEDPEVAFNTASNTGAAIFMGRTSGGAIGPLPLDGSVCNAAAIAGKL